MLTSKERRYASLCIATEMRRYLPCLLDDRHVLKIAREAAKKFQPRSYTPAVHGYCMEMAKEYLEGSDPYGKKDVGRNVGF